VAPRGIAESQRTERKVGRTIEKTRGKGIRNDEKKAGWASEGGEDLKESQKAKD